MNSLYVCAMCGSPVTGIHGDHGWKHARGWHSRGASCDLPPIPIEPDAYRPSDARRIKALTDPGERWRLARELERRALARNEAVEVSLAQKDKS